MRLVDLIRSNPKVTTIKENQYYGDAATKILAAREVLEDTARQLERGLVEAALTNMIAVSIHIQTVALELAEGFE